MHPNRDKFFSLWKKVGFKKAVFISTKPTLRVRISRLIPAKIRKEIKKLWR
jgi:hypothetical protein